MEDFVIENGVVTKYNGNGGDVVIPEGVKEVGGVYKVDTDDNTYPGIYPELFTGAF